MAARTNTVTSSGKSVFDFDRRLWPVSSASRLPPMIHQSTRRDHRWPNLVAPHSIPSLRSGPLAAEAGRLLRNKLHDPAWGSISVGAQVNNTTTMLCAPEEQKWNLMSSGKQRPKRETNNTSGFTRYRYSADRHDAPSPQNLITRSDGLSQQYGYHYMICLVVRLTPQCVPWSFRLFFHGAGCPELGKYWLGSCIVRAVREV